MPFYLVLHSFITAITYARSIRIKLVEFSKYTLTNKSIHLFVFCSILGTVLNFIHYKVFFLKLCGCFTPFINAFQPTKMDRSSKTFPFYSVYTLYLICKSFGRLLEVLGTGIFSLVFHLAGMQDFGILFVSCYPWMTFLLDIS